ncbi:hypothetical protein [Nocardioides sp. Soil805]|uniref:hypothetical protein n=1 Tax=Nocardioides sp. Soil805 TaxID=1736416 RepID=UPI000702DD36|nr:hypothetical protein [Nocardioides sp. Soil805]KRF37423.1 hypothetical protein ASG94_08865 [Nocardioides sp. Soil805]
MLGLVRAAVRTLPGPGRVIDAGRRTAGSVLGRAADRLVREVGEHVDLTPLVRRVVDLDALVAGVDIDAIARRLDVDAVARRLDVDAVVTRVDVDAIAGRLDIGAVVDRLPLVDLAQGVIDEIDLPGIIRDSTGSVASSTVRGVRMQSVSGDEAVARAVDRLRLRGRHRQVPEPRLNDGS